MLLLLYNIFLLFFGHSGAVCLMFSLGLWFVLAGGHFLMNSTAEGHGTLK